MPVTVGTEVHGNDGISVITDSGKGGVSVPKDTDVDGISVTAGTGKGGASVTTETDVDWVVPSGTTGSPEPSDSLSGSTTSASEQSISFRKLTFSLLRSG